jgi:hypothetical protein
VSIDADGVEALSEPSADQVCLWRLEVKQTMPTAAPGSA